MFFCTFGFTGKKMKKPHFPSMAFYGKSRSIRLLVRVILGVFWRKNGCFGRFWGSFGGPGVPGGLRSGWGNLCQKVTSFVFHTKLGWKNYWIFEFGMGFEILRWKPWVFSKNRVVLRFWEIPTRILGKPRRKPWVFLKNERHF